MKGGELKMQETRELMYEKFIKDELEALATTTGIDAITLKKFFLGMADLQPVYLEAVITELNK
ncbi:hypothetical protein [Arthrobacter sp. NPDC057013]|uniref:hypothetical protein n=1 Tax=Arthrobacter sp. NPDC057013 TaxID=3345999 RepID=UPI003629EAAF